MDIRAQNEALTNSVNSQVNEFLLIPHKQLQYAPGLATEWQQVDLLTSQFKPRNGVIRRVQTLPVASSVRRTQSRHNAAIPLS